MLINPKYYNYSIQGLTRDTSEFHPNNINKYPKAQKDNEQMGSNSKN